MPRCLFLTPFPLAVPRHGGQVRAASLAQALTLAGWQVDRAGLYHADFFHPDDGGALDIVVDDPAIAAAARDDMLFGDLHVARGAAANRLVVEQLRTLLTRLRPDVVHVEHPWSWLVLRDAWPASGGARLVYSSQNIEVNARLPLIGAELGLARPGSDRLLAATAQLETAFARAADLVLSISDLEATAIAGETGREVAYVPAMSDLAASAAVPHARFARAARARRCRYAALMASHYWPNVEGFFTSFPDGLGFLAPDEQIWVAGSLGRALVADPRYRDFASLNDSRLRCWDYVADADKAAFFAAACCVIVPVHIGAGAKQKTADALASGCPVIATPHAIEGYGPLVQDALGAGVYVADTPAGFRGLVRRALRDGLAGCTGEVRDRVSLSRMAARLAPLYSGLLDGASPNRT